MQAKSLFVYAIIIALSAPALADTNYFEREGERDGGNYAKELKKSGVKVDGVACAVGASAEDASRPNYTQAEIEAYAKGYINACMGRKII